MKRRRFFFLLFLLLAGIVCLCGCRSGGQIDDARPADNTPQTEQPDRTKLTLSALENHLAGPDPCESFNRSMFAVTSFLMDYLADPIGRVYTSILPRPFIEHFNNLCVNLEFPARAISCLIRAEWKGAGRETLRFLLNITVGIAGFFDPAEHWWRIHSTDSDFGQTFAAWGIGPGCTFVLPCSVALNVRDTVGTLFDIAFDLKTYIPYSGWVTTLNRIVIAHRGYQQLVEGSCDRYKTFRSLALLGRELKLRMWKYRRLYEIDRLTEEGKYPPQLQPSPTAVKPMQLRGQWLELPEFGPGTPVLDSLRTLNFRAQNDDDFWYMRLSVFNSDFSGKRRKLKLALAPGQPKFVCSFWPLPSPGRDGNGNKLPPLPERLAVLLPGIGGTALSATPLALAELLNSNGFAVLVIDSTFTWQFVSSRSGCRLPGFLPADASALRKVIRLALDELRKAELVSAPEVVLAGYSFGGMHTLKIAELEQTDPQLDIRNYLAINPPVSLKYAAEQADRLADSLEKKTTEEVIDRLVDAAGAIQNGSAKVLPPYSKKIPGDTKFAYRLTAEPETADFLAGLYFRSSMRDMLFAAHRDRGLIPLDHPVEFSKNSLYLALDEISFTSYAENYLAAEYPGVSKETLFKKSDLRSIEKTLRNNQDIHIIHSINDFLLSEQDRKFLDDALGERIIWTSRGGHLGHFYYRSVQQKIVDILQR